MNEQLADSEFETALAPYNNYTGGTPADRVKYEGLYPGAPTRMNLQGQYVKPDITPEQIERGKKSFINHETNKVDYVIPIPDTVHLITGGARPNVAAHEFGHRDFPEYTEHGIRKRDAMLAPNKRAWKEAVANFHESTNLSRSPGKELSMKDAEEKLLAEIQDMHNGLKRHSYTPTIARKTCLLYTSPSPRDRTRSRMPSSA